MPQIDPAQAQERPKPANVGTGEGTGLEGAQANVWGTPPREPECEHEWISYRTLCDPTGSADCPKCGPKDHDERSEETE